MFGSFLSEEEYKETSLYSIEEEQNMGGFPESLRFEISEPIDRAVNWLMINLDWLFDAISSVILSLFYSVQNVLGFIPWWLMIGMLFLAGWKLYNLRTGFMLAFMLLLIGLFGLWEMMIYTLAIVIISVLASIIFGLPLGILVAKKELARKIIMPILDGMQTMPSFVYLLPAIMFFGFGIVPAVIATTTYALPPLIRLTYLGISNVNKEVIEAGKSFGSTAKQMLFKIEFPQAMATIMTGINQTTMMAMSMVVISSMIGAKGIGEQVLIAIRRLEIGDGFQAGLGIVFLAIILDRVLQGTANNMKESE
jgi:glycine betaine/proline transport system permease protein